MAKARAAKKSNASRKALTDSVDGVEIYPFGWPEGSNVVIGEGYAALALVAALSNRGERVTWVSGTGVAPVPPLPTLEASDGGHAWAKLFLASGVIDELPKEGAFLREYHKNAFHAPEWQRGENDADRRALHDEQLWEGERTLIPFDELAFDRAVPDLEGALRERVLQSVLVRKSSAKRITEVVTGDDGTARVAFGDGESIRAKWIAYADTPESAFDIPGLPKFTSALRGKRRQSLLQVMARHPALASDFSVSGFFGPTNREAGETSARLVFGGFFEEGTRSIWNLLIAEGEAEDNQMIAKKLRRMKQGLDKLFGGPGLLAVEGKAFTETWTAESVRFLENSVAWGSASGPFTLMIESRTFGDEFEISFFSDAFGMAAAGAQVEHALQTRGFTAVAERTEGEYDDVNALGSATPNEPNELAQSLT